MFFFFVLRWHIQIGVELVIFYSDEREMDSMESMRIRKYPQINIRSE